MIFHLPHCYIHMQSSLTCTLLTCILSMQLYICRKCSGCMHVQLSHLFMCVLAVYSNMCTCFPIFLQVSLPTNITGRYGHSAVVFGTGPDFRVVVLFGGMNKRHDPISETALLLLCE